MENGIEQIIQLLKLNSLDQNQSLVFVREKTGLKPSQICLALIVFVVIVLIFAQAAAFLITIVCFLIPAYFTFFNLATNDLRADIKYVVYWIIFGLAEIIEPIILLMLSRSIWTFMRIGLTVCLLHPKIKLAEIIYDKLIKNYIARNEQGVIGQALDKGRQKYEQFKEMGQKS